MTAPDGLVMAISAASVASDNYGGDGVDDTLTSAFDVRGADTDLSFALTQEVFSNNPGTSNITQTYVITNNSTLAIQFDLVRVFDGDSVFEGDFADDQVGTTMHAAGSGPYVFQQEVLDPCPTTISLSNREAVPYFRCKQGSVPPSGPPNFDWGTGVVLYDAFGIPTTWVNLIAGVGYDTHGVSGPVGGRGRP